MLREIDVFGAPTVATAMPEPATGVLLLAGLGMSGMFARRRAGTAGH